MPHKEKTKHSGKRSEDPLPNNCTQIYLKDKQIDLSTLKFNPSNAIELTGSQVERLTGRLCGHSDVVLHDLPNLKYVEELSSFRNVVIENCPKLESCSKIIADNNIVVENSGIQEISDSWTMSDMIVLKNNPLLRKIQISEGGNEVYLHNLPQLRSLVGELQSKSVTVSDCPSLEEVDPSLRPELVSGLDADSLHRLTTNSSNLTSTRKITCSNWDMIRAKNGTLDWEKPAVSKEMCNPKTSLLRKMLIFLGLQKAEQPRKIRESETSRFCLNEIQNQHS